MKGNITIIDANIVKMQILDGILAAAGYEILYACDRKTALQSIAKCSPDLIILETSMPDMDAFELCRRLKGNPSTTSIPVIFIGEQDETENKLKAFDAGGVDFIARPYSREEVLARVNIHYRHYTEHRNLLSANAELSREIDARRVAEEASLESSFRLFQILQMISVPTFVIDINHSITHWNSAIEKLTGLSAIEMIGSHDQWRSFYPEKGATLADIIVDGGRTEAITEIYGDKFQHSTLIEGAYEVEEFFSCSEVPGKWYFITAAPLVDSFGQVIGAIETVQDITDRKLAEKELKESEQKYLELSITDSLTKLYNSRHFFRQLVHEVSRAKRYNKNLSLMLLDIDNFKRYNDTFGHPEGDLVLKALANTIKNNLRGSDTAYRYGGEEFTVILPETDGEYAFHVAERLRRNFEKLSLYPNPETEVHMTVSIGVSSFLPDESVEAFLKRVDEGMYMAKKGGKNRVLFATGPHTINPVSGKNLPKSKHSASRSNGV